MGNLVFQATLGGQVNLVGPNTASTYNLNVPAVSSTLATLAAQTFAGTQTFSVDALISGLTVGKGAGSVSTNTAVGASALAANTSGDRNSALGYNALIANTSGVANSAVGREALYSNTTGGSNAAFGEDALVFNTTGSNNTSVGTRALYSNTTASGNTAIGFKSLYSNTTGAYNLAAGYFSLYYNTTGTANVAIGGGDGANNPTLYNNTTGNYNTAIGLLALGSNTTASGNTAVGYQAGYTNSTGTFNTFIGYQAGYTSAVSSAQAGNTCVGTQAGYSLTTGTNNTFIGPTSSNSGYYVTTGSKNTIIGGYNGNQGGLDIRTASNYIVLSDGDGNPRGYFDSSGNYWITGGSAYSAVGIFLGTALNGGTGQGGYSISGGPTAAADIGHASGTASGTSYNRFIYNGGVIGSITQSGTTAVLYNTTSDYRLKTVIGAVSGSGERIDALEPVEYEWNSDGSRTRGFLAHKFQEVYAGSVNGTKDAVDGDGNPVYQSMQAGSSEVIADLVAEIQSLRKRLAAAGI